MKKRTSYKSHFKKNFSLLFLPHNFYKCINGRCTYIMQCIMSLLIYGRFRLKAYLRTYIIYPFHVILFRHEVKQIK